VLSYRLTHPTLLEALGRAGHGSLVLLADSNYAFSTGASPTAERVYLNLRPGLLTVDQVLEVLLDAIPVEAAAFMVGPDGEDSAAITGYLPALEGIRSSACSASRSGQRFAAPTSRCSWRPATRGTTPTCCSRSAPCRAPDPWDNRACHDKPYSWR
jgi:D-ribose pyranose/furanose isomerase RbsD